MQKENRIGDRIKEARETKGLSLAEAARRAGVTTRTLANWETCKSQPRPNKLQILCGVLGVSLAWLLEGKVEFDPSLAWSSRIEKLQKMVEESKKLQSEVTSLNAEIANELAAIVRIEQDIEELAH